MMTEESIKNATKNVWGACPAGWIFAGGHAKGTSEFFFSVLEKRFTQECEWMDEIVDFKRFKCKKVLEIGCGAGYDAYQFCKAGADYTGIDITPDNPVLAKKHLDACGYSGKFFEMDAEHLQLPDRYDYIFSFGVLHHTPNITKALHKAYEHLEDKGEAQIIVYYKYSIFYIVHLMIFDWLLRGKFLKMSLQDRLSHIEFTHSSDRPYVCVYGKRQLKKICESVGFKVIKSDIRKLTRHDLPAIPLISRLYRYVPNSLLYILSKKFGWYLSLRMVKK
jgi:SAM-dependent methyltransferase